MITQDNVILLLDLGNLQKNSYNFITMKRMNDSDINTPFEKQILSSYYLSSPVVDLEATEKIENASVNLTSRNNQANLKEMHILNILITVSKIY